MLPVSLAFFIVVVPACHGQKTDPQARPGVFSKLTGSWSISYREMERAATGRTINADAAGATEQDRIVVVAIAPDGGFDWSPTRVGVEQGIHGLRDRGDRCVGRRFEAGEFEVVAAEYTPARSFIEFRGLSKDKGIMQTLSHAILDVRLQPGKETAIARISADTYHSFSGGPGGMSPSDDTDKTERAHTLRRDGSSTEQQVVSEIAGNWAAAGDAPKLVLIIRPDGRFDWTGTLEGIVGGMFQLHDKGDRAFNAMDPRQKHEVVESRYTATESRVKFWTLTPAPEGKTITLSYELVATRLKPNRIAFALTAEADEFGTKSYKATLYRNHKAAEREESVFAVLGKLAGP